MKIRNPLGIEKNLIARVFPCKSGKTDIPDEYEIHRYSDSDSGIIIYGRSGDKWTANPQIKPLIKYFMSQLPLASILLKNTRVTPDRLKELGFLEARDTWISRKWFWSKLWWAKVVEVVPDRYIYTCGNLRIALETMSPSDMCLYYRFREDGDLIRHDQMTMYEVVELMGRDIEIHLNSEIVKYFVQSHLRKK